MDLEKISGLAELFYSLASKKENLQSLLDEVDSLETFKDRIDFCEKNFKHLSSGSSRVVYLTKENTVIKLGKNEKGIAQNKVESNPKMKSKFLNKILSKSKNNYWLEVEFLDKITEKEFEDMTDINFKDFGECLKYAIRSDNSGKKKPECFEDVEKTELLKELKRLNKEFKLICGDLVRISSWGVLDGVPVLVDSGLSAKVYKDFYDSKEKNSNSKKS